MQRARVFLQIEAWGGGLQRHAPWKADGGGGRAEGSHQTPRGKACRKQWGVEGPSSKQGKRRLQKLVLFLNLPCLNQFICYSPTPPTLLSLIMWCGARRSWRRTSRWRRTACWSTSKSAWACGGRCRTTLWPPGISSLCQSLATRPTLSGPGVSDVHHRSQFSSIIKL